MNCARIIHGNQVATNGVVHVIDRVITAVGNTIQDMIEVEDDLSTLSVSLKLNLEPFRHNLCFKTIDQKLFLFLSRL